jgi:hypothetical protein
MQALHRHCQILSRALDLAILLEQNPIIQQQTLTSIWRETALS